MALQWTACVFRFVECYNTKDFGLDKVGACQCSTLGRSDAGAGGQDEGEMIWKANRTCAICHIARQLAAGYQDHG